MHSGYFVGPYGPDGNRVSEVDAATGTVIREYVWLGDIPVGVIQNGQVYDVRADQVNRPVFATDSTGTKVWTAAYLPFGGVAVSSGLPIDLRFPGQWYQAESGLHQNWMRDYDPTTGRYIEADPLGLAGDGPSLYGYAKQNPSNFYDPQGLAPKDKYFGLPKPFWNWYHRQCKQPGDPDLTKDEALDWHKEWLRLGMPGPD